MTKTIIGIPGITGIAPDVPEPICCQAITREFGSKNQARFFSEHKHSVYARSRRNLPAKTSSVKQSD